MKSYRDNNSQNSFDVFLKSGKVKLSGKAAPVSGKSTHALILKSFDDVKPLQSFTIIERNEFKVTNQPSDSNVGKTMAKTLVTKSVPIVSERFIEGSGNYLKGTISRTKNGYTLFSRMQQPGEAVCKLLGGATEATVNVASHYGIKVALGSVGAGPLIIPTSVLASPYISDYSAKAGDVIQNICEDYKTQKKINAGLARKF